MKTATRYLEGHMVRDVATVTGGRYRRVRVDDKTLDIEVHAPERGDWVPVSTLSQGTLDLVYLTARLGLVRLVTGDRRPPLVFDDPFVTLDDERATRALELLKRVADDFQIIYLTTSDRYDAAADAVVELPGTRRPSTTASTTRRCAPVEAIDRAAGLIDGLPPGAVTVVFGLAAAVAWGAGRLRRRAGEPAGAGLRRRPRVAGGRWGDRASRWRCSCGESFPTGNDLLVCVIAGILGGFGITMLYRGLAIGRMGIVAPVTGVLAAVIPVVAGFVTRGRPAAARPRRDRARVVAVVLVSRVADETGGRAGLAEALVGGTAIGLFGVAIAQLLPGRRVRGPRRHPPGPGRRSSSGSSSRPRSAWRPGAAGSCRSSLIGVLDTTGNALYLAAVQTGPAGHRVGAVGDVPGRDGHPRRGRPARAGHPRPHHRHRPGRGGHRADRRWAAA